MSLEPLATLTPLSGQIYSALNQESIDVICELYGVVFPCDVGFGPPIGGGRVSNRNRGAGAARCVRFPNTKANPLLVLAAISATPFVAPGVAAALVWAAWRLTGKRGR